MTDRDFQTGVLSRLSALEARLGAVETKSAVDEVHRENVEKRLTSIENGLSRLFWLIGGSFITAAAVFIVGGGLAP